MMTYNDIKLGHYDYAYGTKYMVLCSKIFIILIKKIGCLMQKNVTLNQE